MICVVFLKSMFYLVTFTYCLRCDNHSFLLLLVIAVLGLYAKKSICSSSSPECKFTAECASERILHIGQYLTTLWQKESLVQRGTGLTSPPLRRNSLARLGLGLGLELVTCRTSDPSDQWPVIDKNTQWVTFLDQPVGYCSCVDCCVENLASLIILDISSNPVSSTVSHFRLFTIYHLKNLKALDGSTIVSNVLSNSYPFSDD